jgi:D-alanine-D-alanine ligase
VSRKLRALAASRKLRVLVLMHRDFVPPASLKGLSDAQVDRIKSEIDVTEALRLLGHEVHELGVHDELRPLRAALEERQPELVFNLLEEFQDQVVFDQHVVAFLELMRVPYTGCNPRGLTLARDKALSKLVVAHHRVRVPRFEVFRQGRAVRRPKRLAFPLIVKSLVAESSVGISKASLVRDDAALAERVRFVHEWIHTDAIAEEFVPGRELYVGVLGNERATVLPPRELVMNPVPGEPLIATERVKHSLRYQEARGVDLVFPELPDGVAARLARESRRAYQALHLDGYARIDWRLRDDGRLYFLEANPNPEIARFEEFASAAEAAGLGYEALIQRLVSLGLARAGAASSP